MKKTFSSLFIANRGEICRRIAVTAKRLGFRTVAITDRAAPPAYLLDVIDEFATVEEETPAVYLDQNLMIHLATRHGCEAVHPGFGFLSENGEFAQAVVKAGLTWIGPHPQSIDAMASKSKARDLAERSQVPCVPGLNGFHVPDDDSGDFSELLEFAQSAGFPLLIKAAYGGGGKGMRLVRTPSELKTAALRARSEANNAFGNGALICERYLEAPRHIEVQILGDKHGHVVALGDRDCSVQRRHQKVLEEAPAPGLHPATRQAMQDAAIRLAEQVGYDSTGTVEFLLDWSDAARRANHQEFYFLEMNTRLQVEHPVTEEVFGVDLVEWQLRVAAGEELPAEFSQLTPRGHSIETRLYAENVGHNFMPAPGPIAAFVPAQGPGVRWEIGLDTSDVITGRFDPMIAKLVATGADRKTALSRMADALSRTIFAGPPSNLELCLRIAKNSPFAVEPVATRFLDDHLARLTKPTEADELGDANFILDQLERGHIGSGVSTGLEPTTAGITGLAFSAGGTDFTSNSEPKRGRLSTECAMVGSSDFRMETRHGRGVWRRADGKTRSFWYASLKNGQKREYWVSMAGRTHHRVSASVDAETQNDSGGSPRDVTAPVPGKVINVNAQPGKQVSEGDALFVLESMKMEFEVKAGRSGKLEQINAGTGDQVSAGQILASWTEEPSGPSLEEK